jgi:hypothetical protein
VEHWKPKARWPGGAARPGWALAALLASLALHGGLLALFDEASPQRWLVASPGLESALASCRALPARDAHLRCAREVVAAARPESAPRLAAASLP